MAENLVIVAQILDFGQNWGEGRSPPPAPPASSPMAVLSLKNSQPILFHLRDFCEYVIFEGEPSVKFDAKESRFLSRTNDIIKESYLEVFLVILFLAGENNQLRFARI